MARRRPGTTARGGARPARRWRDARGRRGAGRRLARVLPARARRAGGDHGRRVRRVRDRREGRPRLPPGARAARHPRRRARDGRLLVGRPLRGAGPARRPRVVVAAQRSHGRQRLRAPDRRADRARRPQRHAGGAHRRPRRAARARGARRLPRRRRTPVSRRSAADRGHPARGLELHARRLRAHVGAVACAHRIQPARVPDPARARVRRGRRRGPRAIAHRLSIAELAIPYADTNPTVVFKNAFDIGEYGLAAYVNSLELGCDCLGEIRYLDAIVHDSQGRAQTIRNAICVHEEDTGILWKHFDWRSGATDVRRGAATRDLVDRDRGQLRVRVLLVSLAGRLDRLRVQAHRRPAHRRRGGGDESELGHTRRARRQRGVSPAFLLRAARSRHRRRAQRAPRGRLPARSTWAGKPTRPVVHACGRRRSRASWPPSG